MKTSNLFLFLICTVTCVYSCGSKSRATQNSVQNSDYSFFVLNDASRMGSVEILINPNADTVKKYIPTGEYNSAINAFLVQKNDSNLLIDAGLGNNLVENLKSYGVTPEQINAVLVTHGHGDHIGGLVGKGTVAVFPNADLYINRVEYDYWNNNGNALFAQVVQAYKNRLIIFDIADEGNTIISGVKAIAAYGHTPGHTMYLAGAGEKQTLFWGDITHVMPIQMPHPEQSVSYDVNPEQAAQTRQKVFEFVVENNLTVAGMHIPLPAVGKIEKEAQGFRFISEN
jgi:glyoxylase-like metal-dependent hydrolase (beta-lactamase superfamily II)